MLVVAQKPKTLTIFHTQERETAMSRLRRLLILAVVVVCAIPVSAAFAQNKKTGKKKKRRPNPAFAAIKEDASLPRVLLIGDSISIGYTAATRAQLKDKANLLRIPTNGGPTTRGVQQIDKWLGKGKWDVIHFNWGLHDLKYIGDKRQVSPEDYAKNLNKLVARLKKTKATLIWCNTTPVPAGVKPQRSDEDVQRYNKIAAEIMEKNGIATDDLYTFANARLAKIQRPKNVHFSPAGSKLLAGQVAQTILKALNK